MKIKDQLLGVSEEEKKQVLEFLRIIWPLQERKYLYY